MPPFELPEQSARTAGIALPRATGRAEHAFLATVYMWMSAGLALTAVVSLFTVSTPWLLQAVFGNQIVFFALMLAELGLVIGVSAAINRISAATATGLFLLYAALNGVTLAVVLLAYTGASVAGTFFVTAGMFGSVSLYGAVTKRDLSSWGSFLFMGLIGVVIASVVNIFLKSDALGWVMAMAGVVVFTGLAAYDTNKLRTMARMGFGDESAERKGAIIGALALYLDFINLFLMLLRLFGRRR
jgi:FtsH-binding integral membrane protein